MEITKVLIYVYVLFFVGAGLNHFLNPQFYDPIVPSFIPYPRFVHQFTGILEILIPILFLTKYRKEAAIMMIILLVILYGANLYVIGLKNVRCLKWECNIKDLHQENTRIKMVH